MADFLENILRAAKLVPEKVDADAALQELNDSLYRQQAQFDPYDLRFKQDLLVQKQNWDTAGKAIKDAENRMKAADEMLKTAGLTDEQVKQYTGAKTSAKADLLRAQAAQGQAHSDADFTRELAKRMGYDVSNYDAYGTNLRDAALNLSAETHNAINSIIGKDMDADEYYNQAYRTLLEAGAPMRQAQQEAARRAEQYRTQREAKYNTAMMMYGNNGDGTLNDIGIQLLGKIAPQSPDLVNIWGNAYAKPKDVYQTAKESKARNDAFQAAVKQILLNHKLGYATREDQAKWNDYLAGENLKRTLQKMIAQGEIDTKKGLTLGQQKHEQNIELKQLELKAAESRQAKDYENAVNLTLLRAKLASEKNGEEDGMKVLKEMNDVLSKDYKDYNSRLKELDPENENDQEEIAQLKGLLADITEQRNFLRYTMTGTSEDMQYPDFPKVTKDFNADTIAVFKPLGELCPYRFKRHFFHSKKLINHRIS